MASQNNQGGRLPSGYNFTEASIFIIPLLINGLTVFQLAESPHQSYISFTQYIYIYIYSCIIGNPHGLLSDKSLVLEKKKFFSTTLMATFLQWEHLARKTTTPIAQKYKKSEKHQCSD